MRREPFDFRKQSDLRLDAGDRRARVFDEAGTVEEVVHPEPVEGTGGSAGGQSMARAGQKISGGYR